MSLSNKKLLTTLITTVVVILIAVGTLIGYRMHINNRIENGEKKITVRVVIDTDDEQYDETHEFWTDENFLGDALLEEGIIKQADYDSGFITNADGHQADSNNEEWWKVLQNGDMADVGMNDLAIKHEDEYEIVLTVGW